MKNGTCKLEPLGDREIVITRTLDAPPELVFEAWTRPELLRQWCGCEGSILTACEVDLRPTDGKKPATVISRQEWKRGWLKASNVSRQLMATSRLTSIGGKSA